MRRRRKGTGCRRHRTVGVRVAARETKRLVTEGIEHAADLDLGFDREARLGYGGARVNKGSASALVRRCEACQQTPSTILRLTT